MIPSKIKSRYGGDILDKENNRTHEISFIATEGRYSIKRFIHCII